MEGRQHQPATSPHQNANSGQARSLVRRIHARAWQLLPLCFATGAIYMALSGLGNNSNWINILESIVFFANILLFIISCGTIFSEIPLYPEQVHRLLLDPVKSVCIPLTTLSFATIVIGTTQYASPIGVISPLFIYALFWIYVASTLALCLLLIKMKKFTPAWTLSLLPMVLVGPVASYTLDTISNDDPRALGVLLTGYAFHGVGYLMIVHQTTLFLSRWILPLSSDLSQDEYLANGAFVASSAPGFTALGLLRLGENAYDILPIYGILIPNAGEIWYASSTMAALMLFGFAVLLFLSGIYPHWFRLHENLRQVIGCWALTFPHVGWILTLRLFTDILHVNALFTLYMIMIAILCLTWVLVLGSTVAALWTGASLISVHGEAVIDDIAMTDDVAA